MVRAAIALSAAKSHERPATVFHSAQARQEGNDMTKMTGKGRIAALAGKAVLPGSRLGTVAFRAMASERNKRRFPGRK